MSQSDEALGRSYRAWALEPRCAVDALPQRDTNSAQPEEKAPQQLRPSAANNKPASRNPRRLEGSKLQNHLRIKEVSRETGKQF
ncbi:unnamed protein product [Rangifer tarandus platyrhynchus]|uniref:Uncharacterized protein n=1 Tax=Rangifer tarandus platyrhynchus TaxID=3082113 RepID=A0ABN8ZF46_RANTA|nr:unnamed protein product [Rangifer tarandus platyrhynchus]